MIIQIQSRIYKEKENQMTKQLIELATQKENEYNQRSEAYEYYHSDRSIVSDIAKDSHL